MKKSQNIYDDNHFYNEYKEMRNKKLNANELIEIPTIKEMLPNLKGKRILDLGCGNGAMSKYFINQGAEYVLALDISRNMIDEAKINSNHKKINYQVMSMEEINNIIEKFDIVFSSLAFHYVEDFNKLIKDINNLLNENGILLFSQEHPSATAPILEIGMKNKIELNNKRYFLVSDYNNIGKRIFLWNDCEVIKYHRNFDYIINTLLKNNFDLLELKESVANEDVIKLVDKYKYQNDRPYFIFLKCKKRK